MTRLELLESIRPHDVGRFADGTTREQWEGITCFRVPPTWTRHSDGSQEPPFVLEVVPPAFGGG